MSQSEIRNDPRTATLLRQRGITLIELLVALTILAFISAVVVVNILPERDKAAVRKAKIDIRQIESALDQYRFDMGDYPTTNQGLQALVRVPPDAALKDRYRPGGYLKSLPKDPWTSAYQYRYTPRSGALEVFSLGADREPGGEGLNADISNVSNDDDPL
ncbi:MAG: type II secretion system major pseudopilin GspG [Pseudomonadota bacterium]